MPQSEKPMSSEPLKEILEASKREVDSWPDTMKSQEPGVQQEPPRPLKRGDWVNMGGFISEIRGTEAVVTVEGNHFSLQLKSLWNPDGGAGAEEPPRPCTCGHGHADHCYSDGTLKPWCDQCSCKAYDERRYDLELKNVVRQLAQSVVDASDEEIQEDARQAGVNLATDATRLEVEYWKSRAKTAELKVLTFYEEIKKLGGAGVEEPSAPQPDKCPKCLGSGELSTDGFGGNHFEKCYMCGGSGAVQEVSKEKPMEATYYVRHPDDSYTEANPQPSIYHGAEVEVRELRSALERTLGNFKRILGRKTVRDAGETIAEGERVLARERH